MESSSSTGKKRKGGAEKVRDKKRKSLEAQALKCKKLTDVGLVKVDTKSEAGDSDVAKSKEDETYAPASDCVQASTSASDQVQASTSACDPIQASTSASEVSYPKESSKHSSYSDNPGIISYSHDAPAPTLDLN